MQGQSTSVLTRRFVFVCCLCVCAMSWLLIPQAHGSAIVGTYAQNSVMVADGTTVYTVWVFADNRPLNGEATWGAQYSLYLPDWMQLISGGLGAAYDKPDSGRDFFEGNLMVFETLLAPGEASGRLVNPANMVINKVGDLQYFKFTINTDAPVGEHTFDLGTDTVLTDASGDPLAVDELNVTFRITHQAGDLSLDGFVGLDDLDIVLNNWNADTGPLNPPAGDSNGDGFVGLDDLDWVLNHWNQGTPAAEMVPEPSTLILLGLVGLGLRAR